MDHDASDARTAPGTMRVDAELRTGSGTPGPRPSSRIAFEHHPQSTWIGDVLGLRLLAVVLTWAIRRRGDHPPAVPWIPLLATGGSQRAPSWRSDSCSRSCSV